MASNVNVARGLVPYAYFTGQMYNGAANIYYVASTYASNIFIGDPVVTHSASSDANGIPAVQLSASGSLIAGVMVGIVDGGALASTMTTVTRDLTLYHPSSTAQYILVADDPNLLFWTQDDGSTQATQASHWPGLNANLGATAGSTTTGFSGWQLSAASVATTSTLDVKIMRALNQADNFIATAANVTTNAKWLVKLNFHQYAGNQTLGV